MPFAFGIAVWSFAVDHALHAADEFGNQATEVNEHKKCGAENSTKTNLAEDISQLRIFHQFFHNDIVLSLN